jgi:hypothetical protein
MNPARFQFCFAAQIAKTKFCAALRMIHFGMEFDSVKFLLGILDRRYRVFGAPGDVKSRGQPDHVIAVAFPHLELPG